METLIFVHAKKSVSLRGKIATDDALETSNLFVKAHKKKGLTTLGMRGSNGTLKLEWHRPSLTLICRIENRMNGKPDDIAGAFITHLLSRHSHLIGSITLPVESLGVRADNGDQNALAILEQRASAFNQDSDDWITWQDFENDFPHDKK